MTLETRRGVSPFKTLRDSANELELTLIASGSDGIPLKELKKMEKALHWHWGISGTSLVDMLIEAESLGIIEEGFLNEETLDTIVRGSQHLIDNHTPFYLDGKQ